MTNSDHPCNRRRRLLGLGAAALVLAACQNLEAHTISIQTAAAGTLTEAQQVVALVYGQSADAAVEKLLYSGGDLSRAVLRLRDRFPRLKPLLDEGVVGNTASGFLALRDGSRQEQLRELVAEENNDRSLLYRQASIAVGHGTMDLNGWLPYVSYSFGKEWIGQGQPGWWSMDERWQWGRR